MEGKSNAPHAKPAYGPPDTSFISACPDSYATSSIPLLTRKTCPSGCRRCISRTFHGMSAGERDVQPGGHALPVDLVHVVNPHRHPDALVSRFVSVWSKRGGVRAPAAAPLAAPAKKDLAFS